MTSPPTPCGLKNLANDAASAGLKDKLRAKLAGVRGMAQAPGA